MHILEAESAKIAKLRSRFEGFSAHINRVRRHIAHEKDVRTGLIDPFLLRVGWPTAHLGRVGQEFSVPDTGYADYALRDKSGEPIIIIEAKNYGVDIDKQLPPDQLKRYVHKLANCNVGAWTNGLEWHWFCLDYTNTLSGTAFVTFDVSKADWASPRVLRWLASVGDQFDNPNPSELLRVARGYEFTERLRSWLSAKAQLSNPFAKALWRELGMRKVTPSSADLELMRSAWAMLHGSPSDEPSTQVGDRDSEDQRPNVKPPSRPTPWDAPKLVGEGVQMLDCYQQKRAWRVWDHSANRLGSWNVEDTAGKVQAAVADWLIDWNGGLKNLPERVNGLREQPTDKYPHDWSPILGGSMYVKTGLNARHKVRWLEKLASVVFNEEYERSPELGKDFEVWLPPWK